MEMIDVNIIDESSPLSFSPDLADEYATKLKTLFDDIVRFPDRGERIVTQRLQRFRGSLPDDPGEAPTRYLATLEVLLDLLEIGYQPNFEDDQKVVYPPDTDRFADNPKQYKNFERKILKKEQRAQFQKDSVRRFIQEMETPDRHQGESVSIRSLVANGDALAADLRAAQGETQDQTAAAVAETVQPYIQVVRTGEEDPHTGLDLMDIWRYFRYTWLTPYNTVPGRNINFLIRDSARDHDPVMGIASLASSMMNLGSRDVEIGWVYDGLEQRLQRKSRTLTYEEQLPAEKRAYDGETREVTKTEYLETQEEYEQRKRGVCQRIRPAIERAIESAIEAIRHDDLLDRSAELKQASFEDPSDADLRALRRLEGRARYVLKGRPDPESDGTTFQPTRYGWTWDELEAASNELKDTDPDDCDTWEERSETALFVRKRAENLHRLLRDKQYLENHADKGDVEFIETAVESKDGTRTLKTGLKEIKKRRVGSAMMNIQVCGAIPPYNHILGGKLVAMALTGPEVIDTYQEKYEGSISKIASSMAGEPVRKPAELVYLDTTSLFASGSAQYDRVRIPTPNAQIEYEKLGKTTGYGSVQFGARTRKWLVHVTEFREGQKAVKARFGEGIAPRMRKIRNGLENLGLLGELLRHESPRIVYGVPLATNALAYLRGETDDPAYVWHMDDIPAEQESIYDHWRHRWVSKRIQDDEILDRVAAFDVREDLLLGPEIEFDQRQLTDF